MSQESMPRAYMCHDAVSPDSTVVKGSHALLVSCIDSLEEKRKWGEDIWEGDSTGGIKQKVKLSYA